ncbi:MAG TPA: DUF91 domain-containing protein [Euryarchaeota archaeon]|nr:DUF91 domain-containing protein [Euryarchaeota archaeon]
MPISMKLWRVVQETELKELPTSSLEAEYILEDWIAKDSSLLGMELLMIGRQVTTGFGGRIDLLAIDRQGDITIIELKRDRTPRDIVAQVLDYASWIRRLSYKDLDSIASAYIKKDLSSAFVEFFDEAIPENINVNHKMLIVASEFDDSSQRIVEYLAEEYQVNINAIFFSIFTDDQGKLVGRAWLMDPEDVQDRAESRKQAPWSGFWFVNVGEGQHRNWDDNVKYGYIGAGQGPKYSDPLKKLKEGDPIFAYMKGLGYVGFGIVREPAKMVKDFVVEGDQKTLLDVPLTAPNAADNRDDPKLCEWAVGVDWKKIFDRNDARYFKGIFANQNIVCKLRHKRTIDFLRTQFEVHD